MNIKYNSPEYIGLRSGYLTVLSHEHNKFICRCDCGKIVRADPWHIIHRKKKSCSSSDCTYALQCRKDAKKTHGLTGNRLYTIWRNMIARCYHSEIPSYKNYGARGIKMCDEWLNDVHVFIDWAKSHGYADNLSIDRINNNGNYEPSNCRWVNAQTQSMNRRKPPHTSKKATKHIWTIDGVTRDGKEWCDLYGLSFPTVLYRIKTLGKSPKEALTMQKKQTGRPKKVIV